MTLKRGLTYPLEIENGGLKISTDLNLIREHILSVIDTRPYERVMRADYGLPDFIFDTIDPTLINSRISEAILREVGDEISSLEVIGRWESTGEDGIYKVIVNYTVDNLPAPPINFSLQR